MKFGSRFLGATTMAVVCLLGVAMAAGQAQSPPENPPTSEDVFKSVTLLRGIPVDTFFEAMGMFAAAMGNDCTFCHVPGAYFNRQAFAQQTPRIMRARQMIVMMNTINKTYFGGQPRVTCFTCHSGSPSPRHEPNLALQYGPPLEDPNARDFPSNSQVSADQVFDRYLQALGGTERLARLSSFVAKGTYSGFDTAFEKNPVEIFARAPGQRTTIVHMFNGESVRTYDGRNGWMAGPDTPLPLMTLTEGTLDRAKLEAILSFPTGIRQAFRQWRVGRTAIDDREILVVQGSDAGRPPANLYFDESGLLERVVHWTATPVGLVPTQIDYADYREVAGVRMPFRWTVTQTYMQMIIELSGVQPNVPIDAARFSRPAPAPRQPK